MIYLLFQISLFVLGLFLLIKGSDIIVNNGVKLAKKYGISELVIGLTIVSWATSLPELMVSLFSVFSDVNSIATGTIVGSNICNIALILGICALFYPLKTDRSFVKEGYIMILFSIFVSIFFINDFVWKEGCIILIFFGYYIWNLLRGKQAIESRNVNVSWDLVMVKYIGMILIGGIILVFGADWVVKSTVYIAKEIHVSEAIIALIPIAVGTSLPELFTSFVAALKKSEGISIGNILGSNIFNIAILSIVSLFGTLTIDESYWAFNIFIMIFVAILLVICMRRYGVINRLMGIIFLLIYSLYCYSLFL